MRAVPKVKHGIGWALLAVVGLAGVGHATAPMDQYKFFSKADETIKDVKTQLIWERRVGQNQMKFDAAVAHCNGLDGTGWRLPTVKELLTLVDEQPLGIYAGAKIVYPAIDSNAFPDTPLANFWSASRHLGHADDSVVVDFSTGRTNPLNATGGNTAHVRCVKNAD
jgi:hypothetical protein